MKNIIFFVLLIVVVLAQTAQGQSNSDTNVPASIQDLTTPSDQLNILNEQFSGRTAQINEFNDNRVFITQAGVNNETSVTTDATNSLVVLRQNGVDNAMQLNLRATTIDYEATQSGNNNLLLDFSNGTTTQLLQRKIIQTGNGQNLVIHGNNALSDRMEIRMNNGGQSIIIRNTN
ncbi:hypothetical protein SB49_07520 [Sediminicola sp. YIK13]|uniref:hypothetical protein n=1 Tax=Sediminicola sp. YIK13 TaxID=1453352 RepID=UPI00072055C5|nr:hypothetical protein [Sediminicola sp. YIK13]ALM07672.1 hypothetical protein SB49_07520 [Sediminicola sp. YIK13]